MLIRTTIRSCIRIYIYKYNDDDDVGDGSRRRQIYIVMRSCHFFFFYIYFPTSRRKKTISTIFADANYFSIIYTYIIDRETNDYTKIRACTSFTITSVSYYILLPEKQVKMSWKYPVAIVRRYHIMYM